VLRDFETCPEGKAVCEALNLRGAFLIMFRFNDTYQWQSNEE